MKKKELEHDIIASLDRLDHSIASMIAALTEWARQHDKWKGPRPEFDEKLRQFIPAAWLEENDGD